MSAPIFFFYLSLALSYLLIRPLATFVHELGHLCALRLAGLRGEIRIFLGSLGDGKRSWRIKAGRQLLAIHPSVLLMRGSICDYDTVVPTKALPWVAIAGPLASLLLATAAISLGILPWANGALRTILFFIGLIAGLDALLSLAYRYNPICLSNRRITANDGQILAWSLKFGPATNDYLHARWLFEQDAYAACIPVIERLFQAGHHEKLLYEYLIYAQIMERKPLEALESSAALEQHHVLDAFDHCLIALAREQSADQKGTLQALEAAIALAPGHYEALNHRAYLYMQASNWEPAMQDLNRAIHNQPEFSAALNNRALLLIGQMALQEAKRDLLLALKFEHENPFVHRNLGMLALLEADVEAAARYMENAKLLGLHEKMDLPQADSIHAEP